MRLTTIRKRLVRFVLSASGYFAAQHRRWERSVSVDPARLEPHPDGRPMPSPYLLTLVSGSPSERWFSEHGRHHGQLIGRLAAEEGRPLSGAVRVLDYGCGCGRIARWLAPEVEEGGGSFSGVDIQPLLIAWCAANLPGRYALARLRRPMPVDDDAIDLIYAVSVVTHLKRASTAALIADFARVLAPGGVALVTFQDEDFNAGERRAKLIERGYVVSSQRAEGFNHLSAWATHQTMRDLCSPGLQVVRTLPSQDGDQAICVLRSA